MEDISTIKSQIIENYNNQNNHDYVPYSINVTVEFINEIFKEQNCTAIKYPKWPHQDCIINFYRNDNPERILTAHLNEFCNNPNYNYPKSKSKLFNSNDTKVKQPIKSAIDRENELRESMKAEGCELISSYKDSKTPVYYMFEGFEYKITPYRWNSGGRSHKDKCIRYTQNYFKQLFANEGCELISEYKNQKSRLKYKYNDQIYEVIFNDWKFYNSRPHLNQKHTFFTENPEQKPEQKPNQKIDA